MANSDKDILITPNTGQSAKPKIEVTGADNSTKTITINDDGTLSFDSTIAATTGSVADGNANLVTGDAVFDYIAAQNFATSGASNFVVGDITGQTALTSGLASTDELVLSDAGVLKRMDVSVLQSYMQSNLTFTTDTILTTENVQDIIGAMVDGGTETNIAVTYDDTGGKLNFVSTDTNTQLTQEQVEDFVAGVIVAGSNITKTYDDAAGTLTLAATDTNTQLTTEEVQDIVGAMFTSNTETRVSATYEDGDGTIDLVVDDMTADTNTQLSTEQVQDIVGAMLVGTETRIGVTYDDTNGRINFVVDDMTANTQLTLLDEDNFATNSATAAASQQSIKAYVDSEVAGLVDSSPSALNTLNELAAALGDDASFSTTTATSLGNRLRVDVSNQGLTSTQQGNALTNLGITASLAEINILDDGLAASDIPNLASSKITSGTFADARIAESNVTQHLAAGTGLSLSGKTFSANLSASDIPNLAASKITSGTFATARIADDAITSAKIADDAIITALIADDQITNALMADDAIDSAQLADASIDEVHLNATNSPTDNYLLSYDSASGGFTWVVSPSGGGDVRTVTAGGNTLGGSETLAFTAGTNVAISESGGAVTIGTDSSVVTLTGSQTLTNKTLTDPVIDNSILLPSAYSTNPAFTFSGDTDTGITHNGGNGFSFITGGTIRLTFSNTGLLINDTSYKIHTNGTDKLNLYGGYSGNAAVRINDEYDLPISDGTANQVMVTDGNGALSFAAQTDTNTQLSTEQVQDIVGAMFGSNTETRISATYQDGDGTIDLVVDDMTANTNTNQLTTFTLTGDSGTNQTIAHGNTLDIAGGTGIDTVVGNTDTVTVAIDNTVATLSGSQTLSNKTIAISQVTELSNLTADEGAQLENIGSTTISAAQWGYLGAASGAITNTDTQLSTEQVQDIVGAMFSSNTETRVSATYQDGDGTIDLVVDDMTANTNTQLSTEQVQDIVGGMLVGTETRIGVSYDDTNGRINFVVDDMTANTQLTLLDQDNMSSNSATAAASQQSIKAYVDAEVAGLVASAPSALNTLNELAAALGDDASFSTTTATSLGNRLRIDVSNQGLNSTQQGNALTNLGITASLAEINILDDGLAASDIPNLATSKITSGTFADARIAQSNVTQHLAVGSGGGIGLSGKTFSLDIDGMTDIGAALADADLMIVDDGAGGTNRKATMSRLKTYMQNNLTFTSNTNTQLSNENVMDIAGPLVATGGTKTRIAVTYDDANNNMDFVVDDMNFSVSDITGATALTSGLAATDELVLSDAGTLKRMDVSVLQDYMQGSLTFTTNTNTQLSTEAVQDIVGAMFGSNTETRITATYQDGDGTIDLVVDDLNTDTQLTTEAVQDIVGAMFSSNTETRVSATYQDGDGTIDLVVDDMTANDNTQLSTEQVQDIVGAMFSSNTETNITATYQDADGTIDLVGVAGDITGVTAGSGLTGGGSSGGVTLNVIGGTGITANANDMAVTAAQTGITSVFNTGLAIGYASNGASIDFGTDNQITFAIDGTQQINLFDGGLIPETNNDVDLGSSNKMFKDAHFRGTLEANAITIQGVAVTAGGGSGDITAVVAGNGLTGGATSGSATLNIGAGTGIDVAADAISVDVSDFMTNGANNRIVTATGTDAMNAEANLTFDGGRLSIIPGNNEFGIIAGSDVTASSVTNNVRKFSRVGLPHYETAEEPVIFMVGDSDGTNNYIKLGGGTNQGNAATKLQFYAAADDTTVTGTVQADITSSGLQLGGNGARVTTILDEDNMATNSATALATQQSIKAYVDANSGGGSDTNTFVITAEESDDYITTTAAAGNANGFFPSYGNGAHNTLKSSSGSDFGIAIPVNCTLSKIVMSFANKGSETNSSNQTITVFKNRAASTTTFQYNASGTGGNAFVKSFALSSGDGLSYSAGDTFNLRATGLSGYTNTQVGPTRMTAYFTVA